MASIYFKGKAAVWNHHLSVPYHTLEKDAKKSLKGADDADNLIIEGDNLLALKALLPQYQGKVKCIYIDPPYNTGEEKWVYNDNVASPTIREWVGETVGKEGEDLTRHDKWLCMMTPRLKLLREMLTEDGVLIMSLDDNELGRALTLLDEIFGTENKEEVIAWRRRHNQPNDKSKPFAKVAEFLIVYAKNRTYLKEVGSFNGLELTGKFSNPDNDPKGDWATKPWKSGSGQSGTCYKIMTPTGVVYDEEWLGTERTYKQLLENGRIYFSKNGDGLPRKKYYRLEREDEGQVPHNFWGHDEFGSNQEATDELKEFGLAFDNPKPVRLVKALVRIFTKDDSIVMDSFAGSGTTAHAVMELNKEDEGTRKFVIVEMEDYANKLTAERVRKAVKTTQSEAGFTYYTLGPAIDAENLLSGKLPNYKEFAKYVYYLATGKNHSDDAKINEKDYFVGKTDNETVYLFYKSQVDELKKLAITLDWAQETQKKDKGRKVVYAPACYLDDETLGQYSIKFVSVPYNLFERNV